MAGDLDLEFHGVGFRRFGAANRRGHGIGNAVVLRLVMCVIGLDLTHASGSPLPVKSIQDER